MNLNANKFTGSKTYVASEELMKAVEVYNKRDRRFGGASEEEDA